MISLDITREAQAVIRCIAGNRQHFGMMMVIDILRGAKNQKILSRHLDEHPEYGVLSDVSVLLLKQMIQELILKGYIKMSEEKYPVLQPVPSAQSCLSAGACIEMRVAPAEKQRRRCQRRAKSRGGGSTR